MRLRIASWNINSVRLRAEQVARFVREQAPDVLCLQETKCQAGEFPAQVLADAGLPHLRIAGQKGWHGVAIASAFPLDDAPPAEFCREGHARCVSARVQGVEVVNLYAPAGGDVPDAEVNRKFAHKLDFYDRMARAMARAAQGPPLVLMGDLNIAPGPNDVWSHRIMSRIVSHTPIEVAAMEAVRAAGEFTDLVRAARPEPERLFSWWSYRARDFRASNRGLRLDHIWANPALAACGATARIHDEPRSWERPSDHVPVIADFHL